MSNEFIDLFEENIKRPGADKLLEKIVSTDFLYAPASTRYHLAYEGGLAEHSVNVYKRLKKLCATEDLNPAPSDETIAIVGLCHDLCKAEYYESVKKSRKTGKLLPNGKPEWEDYMGYEINDRFPYGHGEKSVYMIEKFMRLTTREAMAIRWHMGFTDNDFRAGSKTLNAAFASDPFIVLTHMADLSAAYLDEIIKEEQE